MKPLSVVRFLKKNDLQVLFLHYITLEIILHIRVSCQLELVSISVSNKSHV